MSRQKQFYTIEELKALMIRTKGDKRLADRQSRKLKIAQRKAEARLDSTNRFFAEVFATSTPKELRRMELAYQKLSKALKKADFKR